MNQTKLPSAVVLDANILIALCAKEEFTFQAAEQSFDKFVQDGWEFFALLSDLLVLRDQSTYFAAYFGRLVGNACEVSA